jgi:hypothetical protein
MSMLTPPQRPRAFPFPVPATRPPSVGAYQIWEIRFHLNQRRHLRDRALFDLAIDSKLRGCDLVQMKIGDIVSGGKSERAQS